MGPVGSISLYRGVTDEAAIFLFRLAPSVYFRVITNLTLAPGAAMAGAAAAERLGRFAVWLVLHCLIIIGILE